MGGTTATAGRREGTTAASRSSGALEGAARAGEGLCSDASSRGSAAERRKPDRRALAPLEAECEGG